MIINAHVLYFFSQALVKDAGRPRLSPTAEYSRHCHFCRLPQPLRCYHCTTCGTCVVDMDHHCPFTANCVGRENYPFFFGFILWIWILTLYAVWLCYHPYFECHHPADSGSVHPVLCAEGNQKKPLFHLSLGLAAVMTVFLGIILYMLFSGKTMRTFLDSAVSLLWTSHALISPAYFT